MAVSNFDGYVDVSMQSHIQGWAANGESPAQVNILVNGRPTGYATPTIARPDVQAAGFALMSGWTFNHVRPLDIDDQVAVVLPDNRFLTFSPLADHRPRLREITHGLDRTSMVGLELGPLDRPMLGKDKWQIRYVDHATREDLIAKYGGDRTSQLDTRSIVDTDTCGRAAPWWTACPTAPATTSLSPPTSSNTFRTCSAGWRRSPPP